jgi:hypothetical protein
VAEHLDATYADLELRQQFQSRGIKAKGDKRATRNDPYYLAFDKAKGIILADSTLGISEDDSNRVIAEAHFWAMFANIQQGHTDRRWGREVGRIQGEITRLGRNFPITVADPGALNEIKDVMTVAERRGNAHWNVMDAYYVYIVALAKTVVPLGSANAAPLKSLELAPEPPQGKAWANVSQDVWRAAEAVEKGALQQFGYSDKTAAGEYVFVERRNAMLQTIKSWAEAVLTTRGRDTGFDGDSVMETWQEVISVPQGKGKKAQTVSKTVTADTGQHIRDFAALFVDFYIKLTHANNEARREALYAEREQSRARADFRKAAMQKSREGKAMTAEQLAWYKTLVPSKGEKVEIVSTPTDAPAPRQRGGLLGPAVARAPAPPAPPESEPDDFMAEIQKVGRGNPHRGSRLIKSFPTTRYLRVY